MQWKVCYWLSGSLLGRQFLPQTNAGGSLPALQGLDDHAEQGRSCEPPGWFEAMMVASWEALGQKRRNFPQSSNTSDENSVEISGERSNTSLIPGIAHLPRLACIIDGEKHRPTVAGTFFPRTSLLPSFACCSIALFPASPYPAPTSSPSLGAPHKYLGGELHLPLHSYPRFIRCPPP